MRRGLAVLLFAAATALLVQLIGDLNRAKALEADLAELHHVRFGLLDADQWVERISGIIEKRINGFELTDANRPQIVAAVSRVLDSLLVEIERYLRQRNLKGGGTWVDQLQGVLQQGLQDLLIDFDTLRRKVPQYAQAVVDQLSTPEAKQEIKTQLIALLHQASDQTFAKVDRRELAVLMARHGCTNPQACAERLEGQIAAGRSPMHQRLGMLAAAVAALFALCLLGARSGLDPFRLLLLTGATLILLAGGLLTPMIEIEARISALTLVLLGEPITFENQVLYFQSKSIFEVVRILTETRAADMLLVAVLITLFSVIFPAIKVATSYLYYFDVRGARAMAGVRFFALRSGKWSMADVLVVAIFMAYIGLDGLVGSQLRSLARLGREAGGAATPVGAQVITTNGTSLEPGFYLFLAFVLASLLLAAALERHCGETHPG